MKRNTLHELGATCVLLAALGGCNPTDSSKPGASVSRSPATDGAGPGKAESNATDTEKVKAELAKLSPEDAASAEKQRVCPVTGKMLGSMGPPKKVDVNGTQIWICCDGCREELLANSEKYLAKLKND